MMTRYLIALLALAPTTTLTAQTEQRDTTVAAVKVGYSASNINMLTGAVDKVTQERMNKGMVISSLDALSGQSAGVQVTSGGN